MRKNLWLTGALLFLALAAGLQPVVAAGPAGAVPAISIPQVGEVAPLAPMAAVAMPAAPGAAAAMPGLLSVGTEQPLWSAAVFCPELPADCCRFRRVGNCLVCSQGC